MAWLLSAIPLLTLVVLSTASVAVVVPSPSLAAVDGGSGIASTTQEMQQARYFTFVTLVRMVQERIPQNTTFLMPSDRMLSTASVPENQVLDLLLRHSIPAVLTFSDLNRLPNRTMLPTLHTGQMITLAKREHQKLYFNNVELTSADICRGGDLFRCHGIDAVIRPTTTTTTTTPRGRGSSCAAVAAAAPQPASAANQSSETSSATSPAALEPAAESLQNSRASTAQPRLSCATLILLLMLSVF
ncbi:unnamed protein product [Alopecurus aequalis]